MQVFAWQVRIHAKDECSDELINKVNNLYLYLNIMYLECLSLKQYLVLEKEKVGHTAMMQITLVLAQTKQSYEEKNPTQPSKTIFSFQFLMLKMRMFQLFLSFFLFARLSNFAVQCNATLSAMDEVVESPDPASTSSVSPLECTYSITMYAGYGVEIQVKCLIYSQQVFLYENDFLFGSRHKNIIQLVTKQTRMLMVFEFCCFCCQDSFSRSTSSFEFLRQVKKVNLSKKESLTIMGHGGLTPELLANETLMREGQVIRSTTNQVYIHYRSLQQTNHGMFSLHYQGK